MKYRIKHYKSPHQDSHKAEKCRFCWPFYLFNADWEPVDQCYEVEYGSLSRNQDSLEAAKANIDYDIEQHRQIDDFNRNCKTTYIKYP